MKKKIISCISAMLLCCPTLFGAVACGGTGTGTTNSGKESSKESVKESVQESVQESAVESESSVKGMITAKPRSIEELGEGFNADYLPNTNAIRALTGKIDVCLDFEGTQAGWQALAAEYERLQGGGVQVNVNINLAGSDYSEKLNTELQAAKTEWDIVEGNLGYGNTQAKCIDMYTTIASNNPYCGKDVKWSSVLDPAAYRTKEADTSGQSYIMNTEVMQTCWFINDVAFQAAVEKGYVNSNGIPEYPVTWNDLISLCEKMEAAGYTNPLGITLCDASVESLQFTWLLRVYGDYYYRQFYEYIMAGDAHATWMNYDPTATVPEILPGYGYKFSKILSALFDRDTSLDCGYVGFESPLYKDFVTNLSKMYGHLIKNADTTEFTALRDQFETQTSKSAPQILLDYQGFGINYEKAESEEFELGYFDYPTMESKYVPEETITRDIGGNGGFLSVVNHVGNKAQNDLNKDFVKFVLSPYGQTIYYKGLAEAGKVPKGLSTVKNELVVIPAEWVDFFARSNEVITFSGDVDANQFLSWGVRYTCGYPKGQEIITQNWRKLLIQGPEKGMSVAAFCAKWAQACEEDAHNMTIDYGWPDSVWSGKDFSI